MKNLPGLYNEVTYEFKHHIKCKTMVKVNDNSYADFLQSYFIYPDEVQNFCKIEIHKITCVKFELWA